jgi:hypothetical protein
VAIFEVMSRNLPGVVKSTTKTQCSLFTCRGLNPGPPESEAGVILNRLRRSLSSELGERG